MYFTIYCDKMQAFLLFFTEATANFTNHLTNLRFCSKIYKDKSANSPECGGVRRNGSLRAETEKEVQCYESLPN